MLASLAGMISIEYSISVERRDSKTSVCVCVCVCVGVGNDGCDLANQDTAR